MASLGIALVTGAARGIARMVAERLARDGFEVLAADIDGAEVEKQARQLSASGLAVSGHRLDVCDRAGVAKLLDRAGTVKVVVNCAALVPDMGPLTAGVNSLGLRESVRRELP